ncbi:hypothetical protein NDU88_010884 [Pleurodeles waltl]|uniref:Uncharacterized protein n=1 Tax=Pleurodeles waltl TaxID=8319 RepID=A0AAV7PW61_PLEWA|nr:hypothetical protein NDU88_010884 [Pleurodeles waltl]
MGTLVTSLPRFPVSREMLGNFRTAGSEREAGRDKGGEGANGESRTDRGGGVEQRETREKEAAEIGDGERETAHKGAPETRTKEPSHDPGGSWLTKLPEVLYGLEPKTFPSQSAAGLLMNKCFSMHDESKYFRKDPY